MCSHHTINQMAFEKQDTCLVNLMVELFDCMEVVFFKMILKVTSDHSLTYYLNNLSIGVKLYGELL